MTAFFFAEENVTSNTNAEMHHSMRLFRAQRNFYIAGFAIFLILVIRRLVLLISLQATLLAQSQASMRQAESATTAARSMMATKPTAPNEEDVTADEKVSAKRSFDLKNSPLRLFFRVYAQKAQVTALKEIVDDLRKKLSHEIKDKEALKSQSESLNREYDRLTAEYSKLQAEVAAQPKAKKDDWISARAKKSIIAGGEGKR